MTGKNGNRYISFTVGDWFEELALHLFGGARLVSNNKHPMADIALPGFGVIEVKGADNNHRIRLATRQLVWHQEESDTSFLDDGCAYTIFAYRNWLRPPRSTKLQEFLESGNADIGDVLAGSTNKLYVLDLRVIQAIRATYGERQGELPFEEEEMVVSMTRTFLNEKFHTQTQKSQQAVWRELGLPLRKFCVKEYTVGTLFQGHTMSFPATVVLEPEAEAFFKHLLDTHPHESLGTHVVDDPVDEWEQVEGARLSDQSMIDQIPF